MTAKQSQNETRLLVLGDRALFFLSWILATALIAYGTYALSEKFLVQNNVSPLPLSECCAAVNLVSLILTVYLVLPVFKIHQNDRDTVCCRSQTEKMILIGRLLEVIIALAALFTFAVTQNPRRPVVLTDKWTPLMLVFLVVCWGIDVALIRYRENQRRENYEDGEE